MDRKSIIRGIAGAALSGGLFMACQNPSSQGQDGASAAETTAALLQLDVKDSGACADLHARCRHGHEDGVDSQSLVDTLVDRCIVDTAAAHRILEEGARRGGFDGDGGRRGGPGHDDGPRLDSAARQALCDSMTADLAIADTADSGYALLKRRTLRVCAEPPAGPRPPLDSAARKALCDSLTTELAGADSTDADFASLKHHAARACEEGRPPMSREPGDHRGRGRGPGPGRHGR